MLQKIFCVYDNKSKAYLNPWFLPNAEMAKRSFADSVNASDRNPISLHPEDYVLYEVGVFDSDSGIIQHVDPHVNHGTGISFYQEKQLAAQDLLEYLQQLANDKL